MLADRYGNRHRVISMSSETLQTIQSCPYNPDVLRLKCESENMPGFRHRSIPPTALAVVLLCFSFPAYAQATGLAALAFTPFTAGLIGGVITGIFASNTRWNKFSPYIWFACWVLLYTIVFAFLSEHPLDTIPTALGISALWGITPFALTFSLGRFFTARLRAYIVSHRKH